MFKSLRSKLIWSMLIGMLVGILTISIIMSRFAGNLILNEFVTNANNEITKVEGLIKTYFAILSIFILIVVIIVSFIVSNGISKSIKTISNLMKQVENGDFSVKSEIKGQDELAQLSVSFNNMAQNVKLLLHESKDISEEVTNSSNVLMEMSEHISLAADDIVNSISDLSLKTYEQASQTEGIVEAIEGFTEELERVCSILDTRSDTAENLANQGIEVVNVLAKTTKETLKSSEDVSGAISILKEKSIHIENIINMIKRISDQTTLLALNASIEAARAGEAGKGFGVVANEIGKLSDESKKSTDEIERIIAELQEEINKSVAAIEKSNTLVTKNTEIVNNTEDIFNRIVTTVNDVQEEVKILDGVIINMTQEKHEIADKISKITAASQQIAATSEEITSASEEQTSSIHNTALAIQNLKDLSNNLKVSISKFNA